MSDSTIARIIGALKEQQQTQLLGLGDFPHSEQFEHGVQVGAYRGIGYALDTIDNILRDDLEKEKQR